MLEALKHSTEPEHLVKEASRYLKGLKGSLVQMKKQKLASLHEQRERVAQADLDRAFSASRGPVRW